MNDRFKFRVWNGSEMHHNDFVVTATGYVGKITEEFLGQCVFKQDDLTADKECIIMQCTDLKDKNGKLIYEGDYIKNLKTNTIYKVFWEDKATCFMLKSTRFGGVVSTYMMFEEYPNDLEVIGNIYENKELLE